MSYYDPDAPQFLVDAVEPPSPCIQVCKMDLRMSSAEGYLCAGCQRNIDEIAGWGRADAAAKRAIWRNIHQRRKALGLA